MNKVTFIIAEGSYVIRKGISSIINSIQNTDVIKEFDSEHELSKAIEKTSVDYILINPRLIRNISILRSNINSKFIAIIDEKSGIAPKDLFYGSINIYDSENIITDNITRLIAKFSTDVDAIKSSELSDREKAILKHIALGHTNKEIADELFISTHTVITHRKNITNKLGIKTVSGLTVYAILNKIVDVNDIQ